MEGQYEWTCLVMTQKFQAIKWILSFSLTLVYLIIVETLFINDKSGSHPKHRLDIPAESVPISDHNPPFASQSARNFRPHILDFFSPTLPLFLCGWYSDDPSE